MLRLIFAMMRWITQHERKAELINRIDVELASMTPSPGTRKLKTLSSMINLQTLCFGQGTARDKRDYFIQFVLALQGLHDVPEMQEALPPLLHFAETMRCSRCPFNSEEMIEERDYYFKLADEGMDFFRHHTKVGFFATLKGHILAAHVRSEEVRNTFFLLSDLNFFSPFLSSFRWAERSDALEQCFISKGNWWS